MNSRLNEIAGYRRSDDESSDSDYRRSIDLERGNGTKERELRTPLIEGGGGGREGGNPEFMREFFETVDEIKAGISFLAKTTEKINVIKERTIRLSGDRSEGGSSMLAPLVMEANKVAARNKVVLVALRKQVSDIEADLSTKSNKTAKKVDPKLARTIRVRKNVVQAVTRKFIEIMKQYQSAQQSYKSNMEENTLRQVQIVSPEVTREDLQGVIRQQGEGAVDAVAAIATKSLLQSKANSSGGLVGSKIKNSLKSVESRYNEVIVLEASIRELAVMFEEFAMMVEEQSELLDNIEFQTKSAKDFIEDGLIDTEEAIELNRKLRKKRCCLIMIVMLIAVFGLFVFKIF
ncbi:hypothetical protein TrCOL_g3569 [Triparma columacea]|uniref:t-SNARE coiled-coil homology domain-containing protein n=1 Tax=Triparma columacea TaxID=722753 RepID=A0A9W7FZL1_9STRA|nr:hypothetical protein TrCOL_g3569 [Triparma columacea]